MISKECFVNLMNIILDANEKLDLFEDSIDQWFDVSVYGFKPLSDLIDKLIDVLQNEMDDKFDTISWWIYDAPSAGKEKEHCIITYENGDQFGVYTPDDLYEYIFHLEDKSE